MIKRVIAFLILNFLALAIGGMVTRDAVFSEWYLGLNKAPWTPPGYVFGMSWTIIMICFSFYMAFLWPNAKNRNLLISLFAVQWILNIAWNPIFFHFHYVSFGMITISCLLILVSYFFFKYKSVLRNLSFLIMPYLIWLCIASSLNLYILLNN